ncbi:MAG: cupin domain-containing protein [Xanthomonadaceae bacterium]|nr:cupin domain-containing protein [Xanthomonadaceae bacterium]
MRRLVAVWLAALPLLAGAADAPRPQPITPADLRWTASKLIPGLQSTWIVGTEQASGPYLMRVELAAGTRIFPHRHPDSRATTVLRGTLYVGFGETADDTALVAIPEGAVYVAPAEMPHFLWAKDGPVLYQENGIAPTGTVPVKR